MDKTIGWDEAISDGGFVNLPEGEQKVIAICDWGFQEVDKFEKKGVEFTSKCIEEDGEACEKKFTTMSNRLKKKLRPILEDKKPTDVVKLSIMKVGDKFNTQYSVKEVKGKA